MISVFGSAIGETEIDRVRACMEDQWLGFGSRVEEFESAFSAKIGINYFAMTDSGSNSLFMAIRLLDLPAGSEIVVPTFTWVSCAQAVLLAGHIPVFCDVDPVTMNVRREDIERVLSPRTRALMVVHYAGLSVDMDPILDLGLPVIEDAAHAVVSTYRGRPVGTIGDVGIYSFDSVKNLAVGEGGGISTTSADVLVRAKHLRYCGIGKSGFESATSNASGKERWWEYDIKEVFIKMMPTNIAGAIGLGQLEKLDEMQARRDSIWELYNQAFAGIDQIVTPPDVPAGDTHSRFTYCIQTPNRDALAHHLLGRDIYTTLRYHPLHLNSIYGQTHMRLKNSETLNNTALSLPLHPRLTDEDVSRVIHEVHQFFKRVPKRIEQTTSAHPHQTLESVI